MTTEDGDEFMAQFNHHRPIGAPPSVTEPPPSKPSGSVRLLSYLLQALVMAVALSFFFLFAGLAVLILIHLCLAGRALRRRRRHLHALSRIASAAVDGPALSSDDLRDLPCFEYPGGRPALDCAVCLEGFREGEWCRALPGCNHAFHMLCVDRWLVRTPACPICRGEVAMAGPQPADEQPLGWF